MPEGKEPGAGRVADSLPDVRPKTQEVIEHIVQRLVLFDKGEMSATLDFSITFEKGGIPEGGFVRKVTKSD